MKSKCLPGSRDQEVKDEDATGRRSSSREVCLLQLLTGGSLGENNPMIAAVWEETGDATQAHRSTARVAARDSCFPRTGGCSGEGRQQLTHCSTAAGKTGGWRR